MAAHKTLFRNIASNSVGYVVNVVVALLLTPYVVRVLGDNIYGLWNLVVSLTGYYGLLDLGIRSAVGNYVAIYWAKKDMEGVNRTMSTAMVLMYLAAFIAVLVTVILVFALPAMKPEAANQEPRIGWVIAIMGLGLASSFPMAIYSTVIYARQRIDIQNGIGISQRLVSAGLTVLMLHQGFGILGLSVAVMGTNILTWVANMIIAQRLMPDLLIQVRLFAKKHLHELKNYGFFNFIVNAADNILVFTDSVVIGLTLPLSAVTFYAVGANLIPYFMSIVQAVTWAITPYATACYATGDYVALRRLIIVGTRGVLVLASLLGGGLLFVGHDFLALWMGSHFLTGQVYISSAIILAILACATLIRATQSCGRQILFATQEVKFLGFLALGEAGANLVLSLLLVKKLGIAGVALGTLIPITITQGIIQPLYLMKLLGLSATAFFVSVLRSMVPVLLAMNAAYFFYAQRLPASNWFEFVVKATVVAAPGLVVGILVGLPRNLRVAILQKFGIRSPSRNDDEEPVVASADSAPVSQP